MTSVSGELNELLGQYLQLKVDFLELQELDDEEGSRANAALGEVERALKLLQAIHPLMTVPLMRCSKPQIAWWERQRRWRRDNIANS